MRCSAVQCSAVCSTVQYGAMRCIAVQCGAMRFIAVRCSALQCSAVQCSLVQLYGALTHSTVGFVIPRGEPLAGQGPEHATPHFSVSFSSVSSISCRLLPSSPSPVLTPFLTPYSCHLSTSLTTYFWQWVQVKHSLCHGSFLKCMVL